jgi:predicted regulator of Ras-like GTPase activity (Roadblock/LC7/MglB family)
MLNISDTLHLIKPAPKKSVALAVLGGFLVLGLLCSGAVSANGVTNLLGSTSVACDDNQLHPQAPNTPLNVTPITGHPGDTYEVIITGYDFCTISLANGSDIATHLNDLNNSDPTIAPLNSKLTFTLATVGGASTYLVGGLNNTLALAFTVLNNPPMITSLTPALGGGSGGTAITILGSDFVTGATATVGGVDCTSPTVVSATSLTCTTGAHAPGNADVLVTNPDKQTGTLAAAFAYEVALNYAAEANGTLTGLTPQLVMPGGDGSVITAVANTGYHFTSWSDGLLTATRTDTNVTTDATLTASFAIDTHTLTYIAGTNGSLTGTSPQTIDYGSNGGSVTAVANTGYHFVNWSDGLLTASRTDTNITADASVTASFAIDSHTLTYTSEANGTLIGTTEQLVIPGDDGSVITAVANTGYHFTNWSDGLLTAARTDTNVTADATLTASFAIDTHTLTYIAGTNGSLTGTSPQTIDYGSNGGSVMAVANTGYHFVSWSDGLLTTSRTDTNITADASVTASFAIDSHTLTYTSEANGTLIGTTEQLVIPGDDGSVITAVANTGYHFTNWSDGLLTAARTDINVTADTSVTALFAIDTHTLTYSIGANGSLSGTSPQTIDYGSNGASVTAVANTGYHFVSWSDGLLSDTRTDSNITADASVSASFALNIIPVTVTANTVSFNFGTLASVSYTANGFISPATFILKPVCGAYKTSDTTFAKALVLSKTTAVGTYVTHCKSATVNAGSYSLAYADGLLTIVAVVPYAPKEVKATAGNTSASVSFKVPASNGGTPITRYTVVSNTGITTTGTKSPISVTGLKNGSIYTFKVMATNSQGNSSYSAFSTAIKPATPKKKD